MKNEEKFAQVLSIGEVSKRTELPVSTIRFYEREFDTYLQVQKTRGGHRRFREEDVEKLKYVHDLIHIQGRSMKEVKATLVSDKDPILLRRDLDLLLEIFETLVQENMSLKNAVESLNERLLTLEEKGKKKRFKIF
jgi:DNA-binding transcriptional MerR regulator